MNNEKEDVKPLITETEKRLTIDKAHKLLVDLLPEAGEQAVESYKTFAADKNPAEGDDKVKKSKSFAAHHAACKSALVHLDTLIKLTRWLEKKGQSMTTRDGETLMPQLSAARSGLTDMMETMEDDDEE